LARHARPVGRALVGPPQFSVAANSIACPSKKSLGLFAFLLLTGKQHPRRELAALLWGHGDEETSRASLRAALHRLPAAMAECLQIDRESIGVAPSAAPLVDVERFETLARAQDLDSLETAATLYQDELLKDFEPAATPEFDDWLHGGRVRLGQLAQNVFDGVIARRTERARQDAARATSERESALATGLRWTSLMPGAEAGHRWLMRLYLDMGRRDAALAQYELCQRFLAVTHGRAPSTETRELQEMALAGGARPPRRAPRHFCRRRFRTEARSTVRRLPRRASSADSKKLAELDRLFADPTCRLITLHGLGGAGKTRLAHAFATQVGPRFAQGVSWVALETADSTDDLPASIADRLGRDIPRRGDRVAAVAAMLARQQRLLVLDNFEALIGAGREQDGAAQEMVLRLLQAAPQLRIVVTSREVLGLQEEWVYEVRGLGDGQSGSSSGESAPAIELFAQRARQAYLGFSLSAEMPHVTAHLSPGGRTAAGHRARRGVGAHDSLRRHRRSDRSRGRRAGERASQSSRPAPEPRRSRRLFVETAQRRTAAGARRTRRVRRRVHAQRCRACRGGAAANAVRAGRQVARSAPNRGSLRSA
jgi:DNA-binding SARP family transcriptional activator